MAQGQCLRNIDSGCGRISPTISSSSRSVRPVPPAEQNSDVDETRLPQTVEGLGGVPDAILKRDLMDGAEHHPLPTSKINEPTGFIGRVDHRLFNKSVYAALERAARQPKMS